MHHRSIRRAIHFLALALWLASPSAFAEPDASFGALPAEVAGAMAQAASPQDIAEYRRKLKEYQEARAAFDEQADAYWKSITEKRRGRNAKRREHLAIALDDYVLTQPPVYAGPKRPVNPAGEPAPEERP